ncbi:P-loop NTPase [Pseudodesulfovibrio senegalensis]|jgi:MinD superfamily P-loop ATPase|uniref:P-loop NTPase n=1 Tax=Pseudodesulfovibrio senegalensis TaxID=1721087 RepID=A0A6N6N928_9BACT|nr:ATP-binding protein [Pseudodesulfovibrio senegalensis]KAB1443689.1 P-loop NTPase [Pseudodesulfovibrio senegalensis]
MQIAIASGKGGTGKTTVATNLAAYFDQQGKSVSFLDCDVEEPNAHFFLTPEWTDERLETVPVPDIDTDACIGEECRKCIELCRFKALIWMVDSVMAFSELCHGCGLCDLACPAGAIIESHRELGTSVRGTKGNIIFHRGLLRIGEAMAPPLIKKVKARSLAEAGSPDIRILDCPPGATCPVVESLEGTDFAVLVTEPTPFGLNDLKIAVNLLRKLEIPFGVVINRAGMGDDEVEKYLEKESINLLGSLPHSLEAASAYSQGKLLVEALPEYREQIESIAKAIEMEVNAARGGAA